MYIPPPLLALVGCALATLPGGVAWGQSPAAAPALPGAPQVSFSPAILPTRVQLPLRWRVGTLDGATVPFARWSGRVVVLNVWASWCPPCVEELASFRALRDALVAEGIGDEVAMVLLTPERPARVARFVSRRLADMPVFVEHDPLPAELGMRAVPSTWIVDRTGRIVALHRGAADWHAPEVRALLRDLVTEYVGAGR